MVHSFIHHALHTASLDLRHSRVRRLSRAKDKYLIFIFTKLLFSCFVNHHAHVTSTREPYNHQFQKKSPLFLQKLAELRKPQTCMQQCIRANLICLKRDEKTKMQRFEIWEVQYKFPCCCNVAINESSTYLSISGVPKLATEVRWGPPDVSLHPVGRGTLAGVLARLGEDRTPLGSNESLIVSVSGNIRIAGPEAPFT